MGLGLGLGLGLRVRDRVGVIDQLASMRMRTCLALLRPCCEPAAPAGAAPAALGLGGVGAGLKAPSSSEKELIMYPGVALARCGGSGN